jgi:hypothetical protein
MESGVSVGGVPLPPACLVPLLLSGAHLMQGEALSVDRAVQFLTLAGIIMFIDELGGAKLSWTLLAPFLTLAAAGTLFNLMFRGPPPRESTARAHSAPLLLPVLDW